MADKVKAGSEEKNTKTVDGLRYSTHEGSGFVKLGLDNDILDYVAKDSSILSTKNTLAAIKITDKDNKSTIAVGLKEEFDQGNLDITAVRLPDGRKLFFDKPIVVEFDKETDEKKRLVKGAITEKSARGLSDAVKNHPDMKKHPKDLATEIGDSPKFTVASVDSPSAPLAFSAGKPSKEQGLA